MKKNVKVVKGRRVSFRIEPDLENALAIMTKHFGRNEQQFIEGVLRQVLGIGDPVSKWTAKKLGTTPAA